MDIARQRLVSQCLAGTAFTSPADVVHWLGAVQSQDYLGALWAIGLRVRDATEGAIEQAVEAREIVRTWPMRGTLHFVASGDVRWMLSLLAPGMCARSSARHRQLELTETVFAHAKDLIAQALEGGKQWTRPEIYHVLEEGGIATAGQRGNHILGHLAQSALICFGRRRGRQHTFTLLDEWIPPTSARSRDEALAELAGRYFRGHGPATLHDFAWWSGLTVRDAKIAVGLAETRLVRVVVDGTAYWLSDATHGGKTIASTVHLLPAFDQYTVGYKNRSAILSPVHTRRVNAGGGMLNPVIVIDGSVIGTWKRSFKKKAVVITPRPFTALPDLRATLEAPAMRYGKFLGIPVSFA